MSKLNWVNTSPNSGNGNGSIEVTVQANDDDARQGSVVAGGGLSKTIIINQKSAPLNICALNYDGSNFDLYAVANIQAIGIEGIAYCKMSDSSIVKKEFNDMINIAESEHCKAVNLTGRPIDNSAKTLVINMETTLDFIGHVNNLCELFTDIDFNSTRRNTELDVVLSYENFVYDINSCIRDVYPNNHMRINFNIVDFDEAAKERIRSMVTCDRLAVAF